jgi:hypothetical protein
MKGFWRDCGDTGDKRSITPAHKMVAFRLDFKALTSRASDLDPVAFTKKQESN